MPDQKQLTAADLELQEIIGDLSRRVGALEYAREEKAEPGWRDLKIAQLQEQVRALAAENAALARYFSATTRAIENWNSWADTNDKLNPSPEIPATDAAIREIQAQAVEQFAEACLTANNGHEIHPDIEEIRDYAARIRAGELP